MIDAMKIEGPSTPEKLVMLAEELLRDDSMEDPTPDDVLHALGASIAWAYIKSTDSPHDICGASHAAEVRTEAAFDFHHRYLMASKRQ